MKNQKSRVIIDTNIWIFFLLQKDSSQFDALIANNEILLVYSQELIDELVAVVQRPKFKRFFTPADVAAILSKIRNRAVLIKVTSSINACRDAKDNFLLSLAVDSKATHLITGDKDLLVLEKFGSTLILTIAEFLSQNK